MSTNTEFSVFEALDLAPVKMKLMHVESGEGWSEQRADAAEAEYRRFLFLMKKYPDAGASPTVEVDTFWHYHILDTMKYARDCEATFGFFLHHYPYVGMGAGADDGERQRAGDRMRAMYEAEFGVVVKGDAAFCAFPGNQASEAAFCAFPGKQAGEAAFCAYPGKQASDTAFCAAPSKQAGEAAFCAYPGKQASDTAFCAAPGKQAGEAAFCASPGKQASDTAFCAAPGKQAGGAAFCAAPGKQAGDTAFCAAPSKSLQTA